MLPSRLDHFTYIFVYAQIDLRSDHHDPYSEFQEITTFQDGWGINTWESRYMSMIILYLFRRDNKIQINQMEIEAIASLLLWSSIYNYNCSFDAVNDVDTASRT